MPRGPHGTKCSTALISPSLCAVTTTQRPSTGSPKRPSAIEKPRSVSVPRQDAEAALIRSFSSSVSSPTLRTMQV